MPDQTQELTAVPPQPVDVSVNPSWTAAASSDTVVEPQPTPLVGQPTTTPQPVVQAVNLTAPTPVVAEPTPTQDQTVPVQVITPKAIVSEQAPPVAQPQPASQEQSSQRMAAQDLADTPHRKLWLWLTLAGIVLVVVIIGVLVWQGILFGSPKSGTAALQKMTAALAKTPAYHVAGTLELTLTPAQKTALLPDQVKVLAATDPTPTVSASASCNTTSTPCTISQKVISTSTAPSDTATPSMSPLTPKGSVVTSTSTPSANPAGTATSVDGAVPLQPTVLESAATQTPIQMSATFTADRASTKTYDLTSQIDLSKLATSILPSTLPSTLDLELKTIDGHAYLHAPFVTSLIGVQKDGWLPVDSTKADKTLPVVHPDQLTDLIRSGSRVGYDQTGPVATAHYHYQLDPTVLANLIAASVPTGESLGSAISQSQPTLDLWLGRSDHLPYKLQLAAQQPNNPQIFHFVLTANFNQFGKTSQITPPDTTELIPQALTGIDYANLSQSLQKKARDAQRKADLAALKSALEIFKTQQGHYISTNGKLTKTDDPKSFLRALVDKGYLTKLPTDPQDPPYWYGYTSDSGAHYQLFSILEDRTDPDGKPNGTFVVYKIGDQPQDLPAGSGSADQTTTPTSGQLPTVTASPTP